MLCSNCSKLAMLVTKRICIRCKSLVSNNISILCELCSKTEKVCSVCLKKINVELKQQRYRGCGRCGGK
jgi:hypothetical protein